MKSSSKPKRQQNYNNSPKQYSTKQLESQYSSRRKIFTEQEFNPRLYVNKNLTEQDVLMIKEVFDTIDASGKGILNPNDIKFSLQKFGFNATKETVYDIIAQYDEMEVGGIGFHEFITIIASRPSQNENKDDIKKIFRKYDRKNKGYIDAEDIKRVAAQLREDLSTETVSKIIQKNDTKRQGRLSFEDFYRAMVSNNFYQ